ncbi:MAG: alkaline phosphatase family protein [Candidatus Krumholzibacteria bacterium]|nr:alkaline phosphatase family protein [Candidatus Krumholzibacteria bacterium]
MRLLAILGLILLATPSLADPVDRVILISVDGLRADLLANLLAGDVNGDYANFQRLVDEGSATFNARTDFTHTVTLPNHTSMITGRPVLQPVGQPVTVHHGYTSNSTPQPTDTLHNVGNPGVSYIASVFDVAHDHGLSTALYASKSKFVIFDQSYDALSGAPDVTGPDNGPDKIDTFLTVSSGSPSNAAPMQASFMADLATDPAQFNFVHYRDPDSAGHAFTWGSAAWNNSVKAVDGYLGELLDFVDANPVLMGRTVIILTTDHGGTAYGHNNAADPRMYMIPFFVWGAGVAVGGDLYGLNPGRLNPGVGRPDYNAVAPIRNGDSGDLALSLLGLPAVAGSSIGAAQDLGVTAPVSSVPDSSEPEQLALTAYPNPFNPTTKIVFELPRAEKASLRIYDMGGRLVRDLISDNILNAGQHAAVWRGDDEAGNVVAAGLYFYRLEAGKVSETKRVVLLK